MWSHTSGVLTHGEVLVVVGPNGSGKSTLLRLLCGLEPLSAGVITYEWAGATWLPVTMRPYIGLVAPDVAVYRELTALENLRFFAAGRGLKPSEADLTAGLAQMGLAGREHDRVATFSSGMLLRLKYAVALVHRPPILLLDEPTAMLDAAGRSVVETVITTQRTRGITIIATNDPAEIDWGDFILRTPGDAL